MTVTLDNVYLDPTVEQLFAEYKKAIPLLTVDGTTRKDAQLQHERSEKSEIQKQLNEIKDMREELKDYKNLKEELRIEFKDEIQNLKTVSKKD